MQLLQNFPLVLTRDSSSLVSIQKTQKDETFRQLNWLHSRMEEMTEAGVFLDGWVRDTESNTMENFKYFIEYICRYHDRMNNG